METFFEMKIQRETPKSSSDELNVCLKKVHKLGLEIQNIQRDVIKLYDDRASLNPSKKEWKKLNSKIISLSKTKDKIVDELGVETRKLERLVSILDPKGQIQKFFM